MSDGVTMSSQTSTDECKKEIDGIFETINKDQAEYDKQLLTLSSGVLALSLAFIKDVVPLKDAEMLWLLYLAYIVLGLCILLVLFSYQYSIAGHLKAKEYWEKKQDGENPRFPYGHAGRVKWINRSSGILFGTGVSLLIFFTVLNIHNEAKNMSDNRQRIGDGSHVVGDGAYIKTPANEERGSHIKAPAKPANNESNSSGNSNQSKK